MKIPFARREPSAPTTDGYSVIDAHTVLHGDLETDGTVRVDGRLEGSVLRATVVVIGNGAEVRGNVAAAETVVAGRVEGNITVNTRLELESTADVNGDLVAGSIVVHEGAQVRGRLFVRPSEQAASAAVRHHGDAPLALPSAVSSRA